MTVKMSLNFIEKQRTRQKKVAFLGVGHLLLLMTTLTTLCQASRVTIYEKNTEDDPKATSEGPEEVETSYVSCALSCSTKYDNCFKFMYNSETKTCTPTFISNLPTTTPTSMTSKNNLDVYTKVFPTPPVTARTMAKTSCDGTDGYNLHTYGSATACLKFYDKYQNYFQADINCWKDGGAYLVSVKTRDKLQAVRNLISDFGIAWVGCDDLVSEGTYVWKEDDEKFTKATLPPVFERGQPDNWDREHCIFLGLGQSAGGTNSLNDNKCLYGRPYVCERPYN